MILKTITLERVQLCAALCGALVVPEMKMSNVWSVVISGVCLKHTEMWRGVECSPPGGQRLM